jgi:glutaredoxin
VEYVNVKTDSTALQTMLALSKGERTVPVIDLAGQVSIGWEGRG